MKLRSLYSGLYLFSYKGIPQKVHVFLDLLLRLNPHKERKKTFHNLLHDGTASPMWKQLLYS
jgi:hypothetical protein